MKKMLFAAVLSGMLIFSGFSIGYSQSAEDMARGQGPGLRYTRLFTDTCSGTTATIDVRNDEVTYGERLEWAQKNCVAPDAHPGVWKEVETAHVTKKYMEGNKLVLATNSRLYLSKLIIDGHKLTQCILSPSGSLYCNADWIREK